MIKGLDVEKGVCYNRPSLQERSLKAGGRKKLLTGSIKFGSFGVSPGRKKFGGGKKVEKRY